MIKALNMTLQWLTFTLLILSLFFFLSSLDLLYKSNLFTSSNTYFMLSKYAGLYKITFVVLALFLTLKQLRLNQNTSDNTLAQIKFTQDDILRKRQNEITNDTLLHCKYYFVDIQVSFKELTDCGAFNLVPLDWSFLKSINNESLRAYPELHKSVSDLVDKHKKEILTALHKLEAFSAIFVKGNMDLALGKEIMGEMFCGQTEVLVGYISLFRIDNASPFCNNLLDLRKKWKI